MKDNDGIGFEFYKAAKRAIENRPADQPLSEAQRSRCRRDFNYFAESCFEDDTGSLIEQAPHHLHLQDVITDHTRAVILYPVGFGKTTQITMRIIWELGRDPTLRIVVVSSKGVQSKKIVSTVAREIAANEKIQSVFPDLKPATGAVRKSFENWSGSSMRIEGAPTGQKDPSVASYGLDGSISGSRADIVFGDNLMDFENTSSRLQRSKSIDRFTKEVMTRLVPGTGRAYITDTAWTRDDLPHTMMGRASWFSVVFDAEVNTFGEGVLWEHRFPMSELMKIRIDIGPLAYDLTYRNIPLSDSMGYFDVDEIDKAIGKCRWHERYSGGGILCTGIDLGTGPDQRKDLTVFTTVVYLDPIIQVINVRAVRAVAGDIIRNMIEIHKLFHAGAGFARFLVEDNAQQVYIEQMAKDAVVLKALGAKSKQIANFNVKGRTTTKKKKDLELGIPALAADIEMGRLELPKHDEIISLKQEMLAWSPEIGHHTGDRLMSLWIAKAGVVRPRPGVSTF